MKPLTDVAHLSHLPRLARETIAAQLEHRAPRHHIAHGETRAAQGVFVTLRTRGDHHLRGCVGRLALQTPSLDEEVVSTALLAAMHDTRFPPVTRAELDGLDIEVSVLGPEERISDVRDLDPKRYGVVVRALGRTGVLLPDIDGVDDVDEQIGIACRKAGIHPDEDAYEVWRFEVIKVKESDEADDARGAYA